MAKERRKKQKKRLERAKSRQERQKRDRLTSQTHLLFMGLALLIQVIDLLG